MKKLLLVVVMGLALVGCSGAEPEPTVPTTQQDPSFDGEPGSGVNKSVEVFELPNGRSVVCVTFGENGIDCDWEGWKQ